MVNKDVIVVLHGWGLSGERFASLSEDLRNLNYHVLNPDMPGFGKSELPEKPLALKDYAYFLHEYLLRHKIKNPILVGHSFGGRVALRYQEMYPKSTRALILSGTPGFTPIAKTKLLLFIFLAKFGKQIFSLPIFSKFQESVRRWYYYFVGAKEYFKANGAMRETFKNVVREELVTSMKVVVAPCLLVWGENDIIVPSYIAEKMIKVIKNSKLVVIPGVDHGVPFKQPKLFVEAIKEFLENL